jgi:hypothetical protein
MLKRFFLPFLCAAQEEEVLIPPEDHQKAIEALKALGPERGAKKIDYSMLSIIGVVKRIEMQSARGGFFAPDHATCATQRVPKG